MSLVFTPEGTPASPQEGEVYYDSTADKLKVRDASGFREVVSKNSSGEIDGTFSGTVSATATLPSSIAEGMIAPFAMSTAPTGWLICDGSAVSRSTYSALFTAIGTTWGAGDGSSTFNIPDFQGAFLRGTGANGTHNMANGSDFAGPSVGSFENDQVQQMNHRHAGATAAGAGYNKFYGNGGVRHWVSASVQAESYGSPRRGDETRPFNAGVNYCIKY